MNFELNEEQLDVQRLAREFAKKEIEPVREELIKKGEFPRDIIRKMGELGFFGACFPEQYGGTELGFLNHALIVEEIARVEPGFTVPFNVNCMTVPFTILNWGTEEQRQKYVEKLITAQLFGFIGLTEPDGGSDVVGAMKTRAVRDGDHYVINGAKMFITQASVADVGILYAKTDPSAGPKGVSAFIVETKTPGFKATPIRMSSLGELVPSCEVSLEDVRVPAENLLGKEGQGLTIALNSMGYGRLTVAARAVGLAQGCLDQAVKYCNEREAFGQKIGSYQMIQRGIADMAVEIEAARLMVYRSAYLKDKDVSSARESAAAKYYAAEVCGRATLTTFEIFGGYAISDEYPIAKWFNNAQVMRTAEGSANVQRVMIAEDALGWKDANRHNIARKFPLRSDVV